MPGTCSPTTFILRIACSPVPERRCIWPTWTRRTRCSTPRVFPPLKSSAPEASVAADGGKPNEADDSRGSEGLQSSGASSDASDAPSVGIGPQTEQEFISTFGEYAPIYAERALNAYLDYSDAAQSPDGAHTPDTSRRDSGGSTGSTDASGFTSGDALHRDRRLPVRELTPPPSGAAMGVWALTVILLGMSASFSGWWLATSILQSEWWKNFASFFGLGY